MAENVMMDMEYVVPDNGGASPNARNMELAQDSNQDVQYLLDQCEALVRDRDSWKERAFDAERQIVKQKANRQELIRTLTKTLNRS